MSVNDYIRFASNVSVSGVGLAK